MATGTHLSDAERITALRNRCLKRKYEVEQRNIVATARAMRESEHIESWQIRRGLASRARLAGTKFAVDELELLMGRLDPQPEATDEQRAEAEQYMHQYPGTGGQTGHCEVDRTKLFQMGIDGLIAHIAGLRDQSTSEKADTYQSFIYALEGLSLMCEHAADAAQAAIASAPEWRQAELRVMAECCRRIAHQPPASFRDAIQLIWLADMAVTIGDQVGLIVPGHIDRTHRTFYEADVASGDLSKDGALVLIESLYLLVNEFIGDSVAMSVIVGGRDPEGNDVTNDLSYLCLEAIRRTGLSYPTVGVAWHDGTPVELVDLAIDLIGKGYSTPAFFGDETIQKGLKNLGMPAEQRCMYINSTCVEISPSGASNVWVASPYYNMCQIMLEEIEAQAASEHPAATFTEFRKAYHQRVAEAIAHGPAEQNEIREQRRRFGGKPLQSVFTRSCIERGRDIDNGGADCNWVECSFVGLANLADSMHVIEQEVFEQQNRTFAQLKELLDSNFENEEAVRLRFLNAYPKYGNMCEAVDKLLDETVSFSREECTRYRMEPDDSPFVPGCFCWVMHEALGRQTGATPDGRRAGFPFADGAGPAQGREANGPTAAILSTTSWDHSPMIGGLAYNMKFNASLFNSPGSFDRLRDLVLTYLRRGGFETQINVIDRDTLIAARDNPEQHRDLIVRVGGYCDYFTRLSPNMQEEIIQRTEFEAF